MLHLAVYRGSEKQNSLKNPLLLLWCRKINFGIFGYYSIESNFSTPLCDNGETFLAVKIVAMFSSSGSSLTADLFGATCGALVSWLVNVLYLYVRMV